MDVSSTPLIHLTDSNKSLSMGTGAGTFDGHELNPPNPLRWARIHILEPRISQLFSGVIRSLSHLTVGR